MAAHTGVTKIGQETISTTSIKVAPDRGAQLQKPSESDIWLTVQERLHRLSDPLMKRGEAIVGLIFHRCSTYNGWNEKIIPAEPPRRFVLGVLA